MKRLYSNGPSANTAWIALLLTALVFVGCQRADGQITFTANGLLGVVGESSQAYISTNVNPSLLIGSTGGPQSWDFSQTPLANYVRRMDIVLPSDGGQQASFPDATYAERYTDGVSVFQEWDYYSRSTNTGRVYYGSYNPNSGVQVFSPASADIPAVLGYGSNWTYQISTSLPPFTFQDTVTATVDAFGTITLPRLGQLKALRVNELTEEQELYDSIPVGTFYIREYIWLVPGIGKAVDILSSTSSSPPPAVFASADEVRRVFQVSSSVANLQLELQKDQVLLSWLPAANATGYQVQSIGDLTSTNWASVALATSNSWSEGITAPQKFYRVLLQP